MKSTFQWMIMALLFGTTSFQNRKDYVITVNATGSSDTTTACLRTLSMDEVLGCSSVVEDKSTGNEKVKKTVADRNYRVDVAIKGSTPQDDFNNMRNLEKPYEHKRDSLVQYYFKLSPDQQIVLGTEIWGQIKKIDDELQSLRMKFIKSHINT